MPSFSLRALHHFPALYPFMELAGDACRRSCLLVNSEAPIIALFEGTLAQGD